MVAIFDCCKHLKKVKIQLFANFTTGFLQAGLEPAFIEFNQSCKVNLLYGSLFGSSGWIRTNEPPRMRRVQWASVARHHQKQGRYGLLPQFARSVAEAPALVKHIYSHSLVLPSCPGGTAFCMHTFCKHWKWQDIQFALLFNVYNTEEDASISKGLNQQYGSSLHRFIYSLWVNYVYQFLTLLLVCL